MRAGRPSFSPLIFGSQRLLNRLAEACMGSNQTNREGRLEGILGALLAQPAVLEAIGIACLNYQREALPIRLDSGPLAPGPDEIEAAIGVFIEILGLRDLEPTSLHSEILPQWRASRRSRR